MSTPQLWHLSADAAERYERIVARHILGPWAPLLIDAARIATGERVLDVACGTGLVARAAATHIGPRGRVVGIDLNSNMIAVARSLPVPTGAPIEWLVRSALALGLDDASFDAVLCQQGLQFFPDKPLALREMRRVLRPGGRLALSTWNNVGPYNSAVGDALASLIGGATAARFCTSRQAPAADELRRLAAEAGFVAVDVRVCRIDLHLPLPDRFALDHLAATPVAAEIATADPDVRDQIAARVLHALQRRYADGDGVTYPEETHVLTAQR